MPKLAFINLRSKIGYLVRPLVSCALAFLSINSWAIGTFQPEQEWNTTLPCEEKYAHVLPAQPDIGLALYRFECPGLPSRLISAKRKIFLPILVSSQNISRGSSPDPAAIQTGAVTAIYRTLDKPLDAQNLEGLQARRAISAGEKLLLKDFEPKKLWIGGEAITLKIIQGAIVATLPAQALGVGRQGERASAKTDAGKTFTGTATNDDTGPVLLVSPIKPKL